MRLFRRHRGSQTPQGSSFVTILPPDMEPGEFAENLEFILRRRLPSRTMTARQVLTETLLRDAVLADHYDRVPALVDGILLDLDAAGLEIVASGDVE